MDSQVNTIILRIFMLSILGLIGYIAGKTKYLPDSSGIYLSRVVIKVTAPILIFTTMASRKFTRTEVQNGLCISVFALIFILISFSISVMLCRSLKLEGAVSNVYKMHMMFGNVVFLAFPLYDSLFGKNSIAIIYAIFFNLANDTILWTLGIYLVNKHNSKQWKENLKHLVNGNTIAFALGLLTIVFNLQGLVSKYPAVKSVYNIIYETLNPLGNTTIYLSMLFIGLILSDVKFDGISDFLKRIPIFILSFFKLLLMPFIALIVLSLFGEVINSFVKTIVVLQMAMPCATIVPALAVQYDSDYKFATETVFISTLLGAFTLPLMVVLIKIFG
ncbi:MAG TPA: AEC family transporter [Clostridia bacterium]|nr:AEC family transporter [Clostridia bacterium]